MPSKKPPIPEIIIEQYRKLATMAGLEIKGATLPYTSHNGHMFSFVDGKGKLSLRLPEELRERFIRTYNTSLSQQHGRIMKEYVLVPAELMGKPALLKPYFESSYAYVAALKPKPGKK